MRTNENTMAEPGPSIRIIPGNYQHRAIFHGHPVQRLWHEAKLELVEALMPPAQAETILDAGCGSGVVGAYLAGRGATVVGVDANHDAVAFAGQTFGRNNLCFIESSIFDFHQGGFDAIICFEFIEHFHQTEAQALLGHLRSLLKPGGKLLLTTPNYRSAWPIIETTLDLLRLAPRLRGDQHLCRFNPDKLVRFLRDSGWSMLELGSFNGIDPFLAPFSKARARRFRARILSDPNKRTRRHRNLLYAYCTTNPELLVPATGLYPQHVDSTNN